VEGNVIVELKAAEKLCTAHGNHLINYLKATDIEVGMLLNFGPRPQFECKLFTKDRKGHVPQSNP